MSKQFLMLCTGVLAFTAVSCGESKGHDMTYGHGDRNGREAVVVDRGPEQLPPGRGNDRDREWKLIARREVGYAVDKDRFNVSEKTRFSELKVLIEGRPIEMYAMEVVFANGDKWSPPFHYRFERGAQSRAINLPGERAAIDRVYFTYQTIGKKEGRAVLALYGR